MLAFISYAIDRFRKTGAEMYIRYIPFFIVHFETKNQGDFKFATFSIKHIH